MKALVLTAQFKRDLKLCNRRHGSGSELASVFSTKSPITNH